MKVVVAIDSFKGCLTSKEANQATAEGIRSIFPKAEVVQMPVSDGGEGFLEAFHAAIGGEQIELTVRDPLMRPVSANLPDTSDTTVLRQRVLVQQVVWATPSCNTWMPSAGLASSYYLTPSTSKK